MIKEPVWRANPAVCAEALRHRHRPPSGSADPPGLSAGPGIWAPFCCCRLHILHPGPAVKRNKFGGFLKLQYQQGFPLSFRGEWLTGRSSVLAVFKRCRLKKAGLFIVCVIRPEISAGYQKRPDI